MLRRCKFFRRCSLLSLLSMFLGITIGLICTKFLKDVLNCSQRRLLARGVPVFLDLKFDISPRTRDADLHRNDFVVASIITAEMFLRNRATNVYKTWANQFPGEVLFMARENATFENGNITLPVVRLRGVDDTYPPQKKSFIALRYLYDNFVNEREWFIRADDDVYIKGPKLSELLRNLNSSQPLYIGVPGRGMDFEQGNIGLSENDNFCMGGPGIIFSRETIRRIGPNIHLCLKDLHSDHEDVELGRCVRKYARINCTWAYEMSEIFNKVTSDNNGMVYGRDQHSLQSTEKAITFHPVREATNQYSIHSYVLNANVFDLRNHIMNLRSISIFMSRAAVNTSYVDTYFTDVHDMGDTYWVLFDQNTFFDHRSIDSYSRNSETSGTHTAYRDIKRIVMEHENCDRCLMDHLDDNLYNIVAGYYRYNWRRGIEYRLKLALETRFRVHQFHNETRQPSFINSWTAQRFLRPIIRLIGGKITPRKSKNPIKVMAVDSLFENMTVHVSNSNSNATKINFVLPISGRADEFEKFMRTFESVCLKTKENVGLVVLSFPDRLSGTDSTERVIDLIDDLKIRHPAYARFIEVFWVNSTFSLDVGHRAGASMFDSDALLFFVDVGTIFNRITLSRIRQRTIPSEQVYFPIIFSQYDRNVTCNRFYNCSDDPFDVNDITGLWSNTNFVTVSLYNSDYARMLDQPEKGAVSKTGELFERALQTNLSAMRTIDETLVRLFQPFNCETSQSRKALEKCIEMRASAFASVYTLAESVYNTKSLFEFNITNVQYWNITLKALSTIKFTLAHLSFVPEVQEVTEAPLIGAQNPMFLRTGQQSDSYSPLHRFNFTSGDTLANARSFFSMFGGGMSQNVHDANDVLSSLKEILSGNSLPDDSGSLVDLNITDGIGVQNPMSDALPVPGIVDSQDSTQTVPPDFVVPLPNVGPRNAKIWHPPPGFNRNATTELLSEDTNISNHDDLLTADQRSADDVNQLAIESNFVGSQPNGEVNSIGGQQQLQQEEYPHPSLQLDPEFIQSEKGNLMEKSEPQQGSRSTQLVTPNVLQPEMELSLQGAFPHYGDSRSTKSDQASSNDDSQSIPLNVHQNNPENIVKTQTETIHLNAKESSQFSTHDQQPLSDDTSRLNREDLSPQRNAFVGSQLIDDQVPMRRQQFAGLLQPGSTESTQSFSQPANSAQTEYKQQSRQDNSPQLQLDSNNRLQLQPKDQFFEQQNKLQKEQQITPQQQEVNGQQLELQNNNQLRLDTGQQIQQDDTKQQKHDSIRDPLHDITGQRQQGSVEQSQEQNLYKGRQTEPFNVPQPSHDDKSTLAEVNQLNKDGTSDDVGVIDRDRIFKAASSTNAQREPSETAVSSDASSHTGVNVPNLSQDEPLGAISSNTTNKLNDNRNGTLGYGQVVSNLLMSNATNSQSERNPQFMYNATGEVSVMQKDSSVNANQDVLVSPGMANAGNFTTISTSEHEIVDALMNASRVIPQSAQNNTNAAFEHLPVISLNLSQAIPTTNTTVLSFVGSPVNETPSIMDNTEGKNYVTETAPAKLGTVSDSVDKNVVASQATSSENVPVVNIGLLNDRSMDKSFLPEGATASLRADAIVDAHADNPAHGATAAEQGYKPTLADSIAVKYSSNNPAKARFESPALVNQMSFVKSSNESDKIESKPTSVSPADALDTATIVNTSDISSVRRIVSEQNFKPLVTDTLNNHTTSNKQVADSIMETALPSPLENHEIPVNALNGRSSSGTEVNAPLNAQPQNVTLTEPTKTNELAEKNNDSL